MENFPTKATRQAPILLHRHGQCAAGIEVVLSRMHAFLAERGGRLSTEKPVLTLFTRL